MCQQNETLWNNKSLILPLKDNFKPKSLFDEALF